MEVWQPGFQTQNWETNHCGGKHQLFLSSISLDLASYIEDTRNELTDRCIKPKYMLICGRGTNLIESVNKHIYFYP